MTAKKRIALDDNKKEDSQRGQERRG